MFSRFEWMMAMRYLRARRQEGFISVIAWFSLLGIALGVATLIIVMSVMNGFRGELLMRILGVNGHVILYPIDRPLTDYEQVADRIGQVNGVQFVMPMVQGQVLAQGPNSGSTGALVRGVRLQDLTKLAPVSENVKLGSLEGFDTDPNR